MPPSPEKKQLNIRISERTADYLAAMALMEFGQNPSDVARNLLEKGIEEARTVHPELDGIVQARADRRNQAQEDS